MACPIWGTATIPVAVTGRGDYRAYNSPRADGLYRVSGSALEGALSQLRPEYKARITSWIAEQHQASELCPMITAEVLRNVVARAPIPVSTRRDRALDYLSKRLPRPGSSMAVSGVLNETTQADLISLQIATESIDENEAREFLKYLEEAGYVSRPTPSSVTITFQGRQYLEKANFDRSSLTQAFVAMWFADEMTDVYRAGIVPAVEDTGYRPLRIDGKEHTNKIDDEIVAEIRRSRFLVADFTSNPGQPRGGVYFEAGLAFGLAMPIIWSVRASMINDVHFDTRQYNHITWESAEELRVKLTNRIRATIGQGALQTPLKTASPL